VVRLEKLLPPWASQHGGIFIGIEINVIAEVGRFVEQIRIGKKRIAHEGFDVDLPRRPRKAAERRIPHRWMHEKKQMVIVVTSEELVGTGAGNRDLILVLRDRPHQTPVDEIRDRIDWRIMRADELAQLFEEVLLGQRDTGMANAEFADRLR